MSLQCAVRKPLHFQTLALLATLFLTHTLSAATSCVMTPYNGSDGPYNVVSLSGYTVDQATGSPGSYAGFQYYHRPAGINFTAGNSLYVEVDYLDQSGSGNIGIQYNSTTNAFQNSGFGLNNSIYNSGTFKTAVYRLDNASFSLAENGGNDMRLTGGGNLQLNIIQVRVSDAPTALYNSLTAFLGPYSGPTYAGGTPVDASTLIGKTVAGYQGWYGAPGDQDNIGWSHWLNGSQLQIDFWPDMTEYSTAERFNFPPYTNSGGATAQLFSSDMARTTLRHFQWMEAWGIDGAAVQRFVGSVPSVPLDRVLTNVRQAANQTGRTYFVEYDMSGMSEANLVSAIAADWDYLNNTLHITEDPRYLHQGGQPVIGIFGFFTDRFSTTTANAILDIFKTGSAHPAFVLGSGAWWWDQGTDPAWTPAWKSVVYRMGAWQPWNVGNAGGSPLYAGTGYWAQNQADLTANGVIFQPMLYAGCSSVNRDGLAPGAGVARLSGAVYWNQFTVAKSVNAQTAFIAMFDEFSEGTQIAKATGSPPTNAPNALVYDGMPSDCYLCFTAQGSRWLKGQAPLAGGSYSSTVPGCAALTQPTIPDPLAPLNGAAVPGPTVSYSWSAALALPGGGSLSRYDVWLDGTVYNVGLVTAASLTTTPGAHVWRVRAVNSLGNASGWTVAQSFTATGPTATPTRTVSASPTATPTVTLTASSSATRSPTRSATPTFSSTASPSRTPSPSPSLTPSASASATRSVTASVSTTPTPSSSRTSTPSASATRSATASPTATGTVTFTASSSATLTRTLSASATPSSSASFSASASPTRSSTTSASPTPTMSTTRSLTPSSSPTPSLSATRSLTASVSPSPSVSGSQSPTHTASSTPSFSPTRSLTESFSPTPSSSATRSLTLSSSPTASATPSATASATPSASASPSNTSSATATPSVTALASSSPTATLTASSSATPARSATLTSTVLSSATATDTPAASSTPTSTVTDSPSPAATPTLIISATAVVSSTATLDPTAAITATAILSDAPAQQVLAVPAPNPNPSAVAVHLDGTVKELRLKIYTRAFTLMAQETYGPARAGWTSLPLPQAFLSTAPNGAYYFMVTAGDVSSLRAKGRLVLNR